MDTEKREVVDIPRPCKLAHQPFARTETGNDASTRHTFQHVLAVPSYQVAVVDDVFLAILELYRHNVSGW